MAVCFGLWSILRLWNQRTTFPTSHLHVLPSWALTHPGVGWTQRQKQQERAPPKQLGDKWRRTLQLGFLTSCMVVAHLQCPHHKDCLLRLSSNWWRRMLWWKVNCHANDCWKGSPVQVIPLSLNLAGFCLTIDSEVSRAASYMRIIPPQPSVYVSAALQLNLKAYSGSWFREKFSIFWNWSSGSLIASPSLLEHLAII